MKLLQIGASWLSYQFSGLERYYAELVTRLPALGAEVIGVVYELKDAPKVEGLKLVSLGTQSKSLLRKYVDQRRIVKKCLHNRLDLIVSHCTPSLFPSLSHLGDMPLISHFHGPRYLERTLEGANGMSVRMSRYIERKVYARSAHFIALSHYMKHMLMETYDVPEARISVIPGGVDADRFKQSLSRREARTQLGLPQDRPLILTVRRLDRRMGLHNLIDAFGEVIKKHPDVLLLIAGKGSLKNELDQRICDRNLSANIRMMGAVGEQALPLLYRAADFSIVPSIAYEGFGLTLVESLASGTPVLGTPVGAIPEVLGPFSQSLLLGGSSPRHISEGICKVLSGDNELPGMRECETYATTHHAWPNVVRKVHGVYRDVLGDRR